MGETLTPGSAVSMRVFRLLLGALTVLLLTQTQMEAMVGHLGWLPVLVAAEISMALNGLALLARGKVRANVALMIYLFVVVVLTLVSAIRENTGPALLAIAYGAFSLAFFLVFWLVVFNASRWVSLEWFLDKNAALSFWVALAGLYAFFVDRTLFGTLTGVYAVENPDVTHRAVSVFGSPQVFGIYMALNVAYLLVRKRGARAYIVLVVDAVAMLLSGDKSILVFFAAFFLALAQMRVFRLRQMALALWGALLLLLMVYFWLDRVLILRIFEPVRFLLTRQGESTRLAIWVRFFTAFDGPLQFLFGHGVGTASRLTYNLLGYGWGSAESYFLKLLHEIGITGLASFLVAYLLATRRASQEKPGLAAILWAYLTNLMVVHTFEGLFMSFYVSAYLAYFLSSRWAVPVSTDIRFRRRGRRYLE